MAGNVLTRKLGPLPNWAWMGIGTVGVGGIALYMAHKQSAAASSGTGTGTTSTSNVPDYIFQNYNQLPPESSAPTSSSTGSTGSGGSGKGGGDDDDRDHRGRPQPGGRSIGAGRAPAAPGLHSYTSNGKLTLADVARQHHTTPAAIVRSTHQYKNNVSRSLGKYLSNSKDWGKPIPAGETIVYENG